MLACHGHVAQDRQVGELHNIVVALYLVTEEAQGNDDKCRDGNAEDKSDEHYHRRLRCYLACKLRVVEQLSLVGCGGKSNRVFLALLQKHEVEARLHFLLAANLCELALLKRSFGHGRVILVVLVL